MKSNASQQRTSWIHDFPFFSYGLFFPHGASFLPRRCKFSSPTAPVFFHYSFFIYGTSSTRLQGLSSHSGRINPCLHISPLEEDHQQLLCLAPKMARTSFSSLVSSCYTGLTSSCRPPHGSLTMSRSHSFSDFAAATTSCLVSFCRPP